MRSSHLDSTPIRLYPGHRQVSRRGLLGDSLRAGGVLAVAAGLGSAPRLGVAESISSHHFRIQDIQRTTVRLPMRPVPARNMARELPHWKFLEIFEVTLASGAVGIGETMLYYTWGATGDEDVARVRGRNAAEWMWDDTLGAGLQMALFDAVAKTAGVPIHRLLGRQVHEQTPLSWWNIDTSAEDMAADCAEAFQQGYLSYKTKGRPWFDIYEQLEKSVAVVPPEFKIDMDFNDTLLDAERGLPILKDLEKYPQVDIYESPIPQNDVPGNRHLCQNTRVSIAMHYGTPQPAIAIREQVCDGFVIGGGAGRTMGAASLAAAADMPFWLQLVGSSLTAHYSLHFGAVCSHATWPAVNCHQLFSDQIVTDVPRVVRGKAAVPNRPGIGTDLDRDALEKYKVVKPRQRPEPQRLIETAYPDGQRIFTASDGTVNFMLRAGQQGKYPFFKAGAVTRFVPDDGSQWWREMVRRARRGPVVDR